MSFVALRILLRYPHLFTSYPGSHIQMWALFVFISAIQRDIATMKGVTLSIYYSDRRCFSAMTLSESRLMHVMVIMGF